MNRKFLKSQNKFLFGLIFLLLFSPGVAIGGIWPFWPLNEICAYCAWWDPWCNFLGCPFGYLISLGFRFPVMLFALLGVALSFIGIFLGRLIVPPFSNTLIKLSLGQSLGIGGESIYDQFFQVWNSVRNFSLELVEIFLLIIGLLTIFRIREYEARKTLVSLIIAALLVSFSFTIGKTIIKWSNDFIIDVGNKFLGVGVGGNYFPGVETIYGDLLDNLLTHFIAGFKEIIAKDGNLWHFLTQTLWMLIFISISYWVFAFLTFYISFVLLALGIVFLIRMIYLICLLIVSPIAFLTAGLRTKEIKQIFGGFLNWDGWWPAFLEWAFVGVVLIIWLGVGIKIFEAIKPMITASFINELLKIIDCSQVISNADPEVVKYCNDEVGLLIPSLFTIIPTLALAVAVHIGVKTSPGIIKQAVGGIITTAGLVTTAAVAAGTAAITAGASAAASGAGALESIKTAFKHGAGTFAGRLAAGVPEMKKVLPEELRPGLETAAAAAEEFEKRVGLVRRMRRPLIYSKKEAEKEVERTFEEEGVKGVLALAENPLMSAEVRKEAIEMLMEKGVDKGEEWVKNKDMQKLMLQMYEEAAKKGDKKTMAMMERRLVKSLAEDAELQRSFRETGIKYGIYKKEEFEKLTEEEKRRKYLEEILKGVKTADDVKQLQKGWYKNAELLATAIEHDYLGGPQLRALGEDREFVEFYSRKIQHLIDRIGIDEFVRRHPRQAMYLAGSAAQELGYTAPPSLTRERIRELKRRWEEEERRIEEGKRRAEEKRRRREEEEALRSFMRREMRGRMGQ